MATNKKIERVDKVDTPEILEKIVSLRSKDYTYRDIVETLKEEFNLNITQSRVSQLYKKAIARSVTKESRTGKKFSDFSEELDRMYRRSVALMEEYVTALEHIASELADLAATGELETISAKKMLIKTIPEATKIMKELREFMKLHLEQQDKIIETQQQEAWTFQDFMDNTKESLDLLEKEGMIVKLNREIEDE